MTSADTYKIQNKTSTCNHDDVDFYQVSQTTLYCTAESKNSHKEIPSQIHLELCDTCYWCATFLINTTPVKCPYCNSIKLDSIPVSHNEICKFKYDPTRGVTMEFSTREGTARPMYIPTDKCSSYE